MEKSFGGSAKSGLITLILLISISWNAVQGQSCSCGSGITFTPVSASGCSDYIVEPSGVTKSCPGALLWDTNACTCNWPSQVTCATDCQLPPTTTTEAPVMCPANYELNPFSNTCFTIVTTPKNQADATADCESHMETLAVLDTLETIAWFKNLRQTNPTWKNGGWVWIAAKKVGGEFKWLGRLATSGGTDGPPMNMPDWETGQPDGGGDCIHVFSGSRARANNALRENYKFDDITCSRTNSYVCELTPGTGVPTLRRPDPGFNLMAKAEEKTLTTETDVSSPRPRLATGEASSTPYTEFFFSEDTVSVPNTVLQTTTEGQLPEGVAEGEGSQLPLK